MFLDLKRYTYLAGSILRGSGRSLDSMCIRYRALIAGLLVLVGGQTLAVSEVSGPGQLGRYFLGWDEFQDWERTASLDSVSLLSPLVQAPLVFDQVILSWNTMPGETAPLEFSVQVSQPEGWSRPYVLGRWAPGAQNELRTSVGGQSDQCAKVLTDTLVLTEPVSSLRVGVKRLGSEGDVGLSFVGVSLLNSQIEVEPLGPVRSCWGTELAVPQLCQLDYEGGGVWCSPTSVGMVMSHWANVLHRDELRRTVPDLAAQVFDPAWGGTGNWPFNTAFAGGFSGIRGCVVRLGDVSELEAFVEAGVPVVVSVAYSVLKREPKRASDGHLIVCVGFTEKGDIIVNDPAKKGRVRWVYGRKAFQDAWSRSRNTAYLVYPEDWELPVDSFGHWSAGSR